MWRWACGISVWLAWFSEREKGALPVVVCLGLMVTDLQEKGQLPGASLSGWVTGQYTVEGCGSAEDGCHQSHLCCMCQHTLYRQYCMFWMGIDDRQSLNRNMSPAPVRKPSALWHTDTLMSHQPSTHTLCSQINHCQWPRRTVSIWRSRSVPRGSGQAASIEPEWPEQPKLCIWYLYILGKMSP